MTKALENIRIYGDHDGAVYVGDLGTTFPTGLATPDDGDFPEVGWISEDGVDVSTDKDVASFNGWQGGKLVRRRVTSTTDMFKFQALEENLVTMGLLLPGALITTAGGITRIKPAAGTITDERAFIADFVDGDVHKRYEVIRGEAIFSGTIPHKNTDMTIMEFEVTMYEYEIVTNNPALVTA
ncbi:hypothetical protein ASD11_01210 [Aeromicrobium sp. Root495]|uniref:phage tail tube protein n=1 Tax=Aeromicrobium sp. Root495 TaxID=1736550 RepID=UPI0007014F59|nr:hypothetical protein [Aeromicrobium sp. Root495]KQY58314.1 hypothetical protein ASD11_01210 [Aeromicrobium sp. Root495]